LGGCSDTKGISVATVQHRTSSSSVAPSEIDNELLKDMYQKVDKVSAKIDQLGTKEDYEKAKQDLVAEKQQSSELRNKLHGLQTDAQQMQQIAEKALEAERERHTNTCKKKDMDLSDMEQKCRDLKNDLERREHEVDQQKGEIDKLNELQREHNSKISDYIEKMVDQHNTKVKQIEEQESALQEKDQKIREMTSQIKDEKQKKESEVAKRRVLEQQMKDARANSTSLEEQIADLKRLNEDLHKARDQATKSARAEQSKVKVLDEQKRELERERSAATEQKAQLESDFSRLKERLKSTIGEFEQYKAEHANDVAQAKRSRIEEVNDLRNRVMEAEGQVQTMSKDIEQATCQKERAEQLLAEERQEFQINKNRIDDLKKQLERVDKERSRKMSVEHDKENQKLHETVKCQKSTIWDLESQLRQERGAGALLSPQEAARILKVREDALIQDNNKLNMELCLAKEELQRIKGGPKSQHPQLEMQQQPSFADVSSLASPQGNRNSQ